MITSHPGPVPPTWDAVTPEWLSAVLDDDVREVEVLFADDGTNRRARLGLTYGPTSSGSLPDVVFAKAEGEHREVHARNGNLFNEADLFASGAELPLDHPVVFGVVIDRENLDYLLVMEDLTQRGADPRDSTRPMTPSQVSSGLVNLARLHATHWGTTADSDVDLAWVQTWAATAGWQIGLRRMIPIGLERGRSSLPSDFRDWSGDAIVDLWAAFVDTLASGPLTLLHGDAHIGNTYVLPDDTVGFLDWQVVRRGNWSQDVGYFLQGALTTSLRRTHEKELVATYADALGLVSEDEAWLRYRASAVYGLAIWLSTLGTDGYQSRAVSLALAERYAAATLDLDARGALAELAASPPSAEGATTT